ncbi:MAG: hypothetical protein QME81_04975 [bacterium]|nr:hypothetical protein [bacterium]
MAVVHPEFVVDKHQNRKAVLLSYEEWQKIVEEMEELADVKAYDQAKASPSDPLPFEDAVREIREGNIP